MVSLNFHYLTCEDASLNANDFFIGVDGGGSKTKVRIEDAQGNLLGQAISGPSNIRISVDNAWHSIRSAIEEILQQHHLSLTDTQHQFHLGLGLAGCEIPDAVQAFLKKPQGYATVLLESDAHIACLGAHQANQGAIIIVGTGVVGYQMEAGQSTRVSGWGFPHDDEGGGAWLGLEAARLTFQWLDHRIDKSPLVEDIFAFFNHDAEQFVTWANQANSTEFARLAPLVINHSQQEESVAVRLMKKAAQAIDRVDHALKKRRQQTQPFGCCLLGGIAPFIEPWLSEDLRAHLVARQGDANAGAIWMIRERVKKEKS